MVIEVRNLLKRYGELVAVRGLSFEVKKGEIFGLLGPNGAGKTTTIRILMDILKPDEGEVRVLGHSPSEVKEKVGYLPEERGLYQGLGVLETLVYFAELKGVPPSVAKERANSLLEKVDLLDRAKGKVKELSKGMQQKLQFIASIIHDPEVVFLDEPFQGLDPVNVELIKGLITELREQGKTVVLSSHQMNLVEALCDRILLINKGEAVLYGPIREIKKRFTPNSILVKSPQLPPIVKGVQAVTRKDDAFLLTLAEGTSPQAVIKALVEEGVELEAFEVAPVPLEDIFVKVVKEGRHSALI
jgi:ABC-2 type transport system ATP-binding protein